ncbi:uncharacterized protein SOCE26_018780 [Sorangium cellulosum]|uniref:SnoaL-like domain-containing protein n=1 Tax=Sorangium cellulosum TaxID=56 RepID=A0A2L0EMF2_SORCE|nr:nuclear transport factor 2 family protein [Sorangium cellulosum]AUX40477.1 uncharacterized protein SOCE26_018780 [Sorangium cellulosum]
MPTLPERVHNFLTTVHTDGMRAFDRLEPFYAPDARFIAPNRESTGRAAGRKNFERFMERMEYVRYDEVKVVGEAPIFMARWTMVFRQKGGSEISIPGTSEFHVEGDHIVLQRDYWDMLCAFISAFPRLASLYRRAITHRG